MAFEPRTTPTRDLLAVDAGSDVHDLAEIKRASTASAAVRPARASVSAIRAAALPADRATVDVTKTMMAFSAQILDRMMAGGTTTTLEVRGPHAEQYATLQLVNGDLTHVQCTTPALSLGRRLIRSGNLTDDRYGHFLDLMLKTPDARLGQLLLDENALTRPQLHAALCQQLLRKSLHILRWNQALYAEAPDANFAATELVGSEPVRATRLQLAFSLAKCEALLQIHAVYSEQGEAFARVRSNRDGIARELELSPALTRLVRRMDGQENLQKLAAAGGDDAWPLLDALHATGTLELSDAPPSRLAPRSPTMLREASEQSAGGVEDSSGLHAFLAATDESGASLTNAASSGDLDKAAIAETSVQGQANQEADSSAAAGASDASGDSSASANLGKMRLRSVTLSVRKVPMEHDGSERSLRLLAELHFLNGRNFAKFMQFSRSVAAFEHALSLLPRAFEYALYVAWARFRLDQTNGAQHREKLRQVAGDALVLEPTLAFAYYALGELAYDEGAETDASVHFGEAVLLDPGLTEAHTRLRAIEKKQRARELALEATREMDAAEEAFRLATAHLPRQAPEPTLASSPPTAQEPAQSVRSESILSKVAASVRVRVASKVPREKITTPPPSTTIAVMPPVIPKAAKVPSFHGPETTSGPARALTSTGEPPQAATKVESEQVPTRASSTRLSVILAVLALVAALAYAFTHS
jgi:tetratricopeptide (TPR) repeat protein